MSPSATLVGWIRTGSPAARARRDRLGPDRLDAVDPDARPPLLERGRHPRDQPAAADADDGHVDVGQVLEDLEADRAVAGDDERVVERVAVDEALLLADPVERGERLVHGVALEDDPRPVAARLPRPWTGPPRPA